jgi:hypothetical protein
MLNVRKKCRFVMNREDVALWLQMQNFIARKLGQSIKWQGIPEIVSSSISPNYQSY